MAFWQLVDTETYRAGSDLQTTEVYVAAYSNGTMVKNVTTWTDTITGLTKAVSESMAFASNASGGGGGGSGPIGAAASVYNEVTDIPENVPTTILTFIAPPSGSGTTYMYRVDVEGTDAALYIVEINGSTSSQRYTAIAGPFNASIDYSAGNSAGLMLNPGDTVTVTVTHSRPDPGNFSARILYVLATS